MGGPPVANSGNSIQTQRHIRGYFGCLKLGGGLSLKVTLFFGTYREALGSRRDVKHLKDDTLIIIYLY